MIDYDLTWGSEPDEGHDFDDVPAAPLRSAPVVLGSPVGLEIPAWMDEGACAGMATDIFFPPEGGTNVAAQAKAICRGCGVRDACLDFAIENGQRHGIWGGMSQNERKAEISRRHRYRRNGWTTP